MNLAYRPVLFCMKSLLIALFLCVSFQSFSQLNCTVNAGVTQTRCVGQTFSLMGNV
jgi:hypothetical protein